jgi:DNA-binding transcriptional LysR family regulator
VRFGEPEPSSLVRRLLFQTRVVTCASPAYIAKHGRPKHPRDFANGKHECIRFRDPRTRRPFGWFLQRGDEMIDVDVKGRLVVSSVATMLAACTAGYGIAQVIELGIGELFRDGDLVQLLPEWSDEKFPLSVYYPSRNHPPARVRAFVDFIVDVAR